MSKSHTPPSRPPSPPITPPAAVAKQEGNLSGNSNSRVPLLALPRGRIEQALAPLLAQLGLPLASEFDKARKLVLPNARGDLRTLRVRSFDVATFVALGAADMGIVGRDVLDEEGAQGLAEDLYVPLDLRIGRCRLCLAAPIGVPNIEASGNQHIRIATKYPNSTKAYFAKRGVQAQCVKLHGSVELAPMLGLAGHIVDLVDSGRTLHENGLQIVDTISHCSCLLIVNRMAMKLRAKTIEAWITRFADGLTNTDSKHEGSATDA